MMRSVRIAAGALGAALGAVVAGLATEALAQEAASAGGPTGARRARLY